MKKSLYILSELSDRDFEWLVQVGRKRLMPAGTVLIEEGRATDALYIVVDGTLTVTVEALDGREVATLGTGEVVGEMSFVDARPPSATVKAIEDTVVWSIPNFQLIAKLSQDVAFAAHFYQALAILLSDRLRNTVTQFGHVKAVEKDAHPDEDLNPRVLQSLEIAKMRLDWLLKRLRQS